MDIAVIGSNMVDLITYIDDMPQIGETNKGSPPIVIAKN